MSKKKFETEGLVALTGSDVVVDTLARVRAYLTACSVKVLIAEHAFAMQLNLTT
jgi:hypothetical protein